MIVLAAATDSLQVVLGAAQTSAPMQCYACYRDLPNASDYTPGRTVILTAGTVPVAVASGPVTGARVVDTVSVFNSDTATKLVTVQFVTLAATMILWRGNIAPGEKLEYIEGAGFRLFDLNGIAKTTAVEAGAAYVTGALNVVTLASDVVNNNVVANTLANVTGLSFPVNANETYYFYAAIPYTAAAATTGSRWTISGPVSPTLLHYDSDYPLTVTTQTSNRAQAAYGLPAAANASSLVAGNVATLEGFIRPSLAGTVQVQFASEILSSAITAKAGAVLQWMRTL